MPSRLTFGIELEFSFAALQPGTPDPEPHLPQPVFILPGLDDSHLHPKYIVFDAIAAKLVEAGLPARAVKHFCDSHALSNESSPSSGSGSSRYQDDGVGWIPSRRHRWVRGDEEEEKEEEEEEEGALKSGGGGGGGGGGEADSDADQGEKKPDDHGNEEGEKGREEGDQGFGAPVPSMREWDDEYGPEWMVTEDVTVEPTNPNDYEWFAVEVQSPPYIFCADALQAIRLACSTLTRTFRLETNASTGLHVHIGHGADGPRHSTLRNLMAFLWAFEPQLDQLHPSRRAGLPASEDEHEHEDEGSWYESLRRGSRLALGEHDGSFERPRSVLAGLRAIYAVAPPDAAAKLDDLLRAPRCRSAYHIGNVAYGGSGAALDGGGGGGGGGGTIKRTVEFRQHAGTLDGGRIAMWVSTVVGIVEFVDEVDGLRLWGFLRDVAGVEDVAGEGGGDGDGDGDDSVERERKGRKKLYDIVQLLRDIGLADCANYWDEKIPISRRVAPTPYYSTPRKLMRRPAAGQFLGETTM